MSTSRTVPDFEPQPDLPGARPGDGEPAGGATQSSSTIPQPYPPGPSEMPPTTDFRIDVSATYLNYEIGGSWSATYGFLLPPNTDPSALDDVAPFNTELTPFLLPSNITRFGGQQSVLLGAASPPVFWRLTIKFLNNGSPILVQGHDHKDADVGPIVQPGTSAEAGYTPINSQKPWLWQPTDLPADTPVVMRLTVSAFSDEQHTSSLQNVNTHDTLDIWVKRVSC